MNIDDIFRKDNGRDNASIPSPNVTVKQSGDKPEWTEEQIRGIICNPIYAGIGSFPSYISDEEWIKCAAIQISKEGAEQFLVNLLYVLRECFPKE
jgi:hypothetical protein